MADGNNILELLCGDHAADWLIELMRREFEDFDREADRYAHALALLQQELGSDSVQAEADALRMQIASMLLYCGGLGFKANLDHFLDPVARDFLSVDTEVFLRENIAHTLPDYIQAQAVRNRFYATLSPEQRTLYTDVLVYNSHLETVGPKLAHYYGYLLGNALLPRITPGYQPDHTHTLRYCKMLEEYFGKRGLPAWL